MQVDNNTVKNIPINSYLAINGDKNNEDHIIKKRTTTGARIMADKLINDIFSYTPKGMTGSKNSNFYEFLSLGLVPNIIGSTMLILIPNLLNKTYEGSANLFAKMNGKKVGAGVVLYAVGKFVGNKIINKGVHAKTGIDLEMPYKKIVHELPEGKKSDSNKTSVEFHRVFESTDFPRWDLINKMGEANGNRYEYYDKIAKKMGYEEKLNAPDQVVQPKIREVLVKSIAAKSISSYVWAALGCAIASQDAFGNFMSHPHTQNYSFKETMKALPKETWNAVKDSTKSLAKTKVGKALIGAACATSILGIWNATRTFKPQGKNDITPTVDYNGSYMEF